MSVGYGLECEEGEVDLGWGDCNDFNSNHTDGCMSSGCYSIEGTTFIFFYESTGNLLQGEISPNIGELVNLTLVRLDDINQLTGVIPSEIGNLTNLQYLTLENNQLTGVIPLEVGNLTNLEYLKLTNNQVSGDIPSGIWNLTNLRYLYLGGNQLTGEIPSEIENLTSLVDLKLGNNQLTGEIPIELWSMNQNSLNFFDLSNNQLTGGIPDEIENSIFIFSFYLNDNQLSGIIPENTCQINFIGPYSDQFKFENNNFCPPYPECLVNQEPFTDENENGIWDEGEPFVDTNNNGIYEQDYVGNQDISECIDYQLGDVNIDGQIDNIDIVLGVNIILGIIEPSNEQIGLIDYNQDNENNIFDILKIVDYVLNN
jgi:Leucine-rich repeat (LRR) protein|tara:strand:- start:527 stop:1636 length:1110 start_codon:yes stop_codon:yes gene_type:complete